MDSLKERDLAFFLHASKKHFFYKEGQRLSGKMLERLTQEKRQE